MRYGAKAAFNDAMDMTKLEVELLEVHLGPEDLPRRRDVVVTTFRDISTRTGLDLVVHAPEFMVTPSGPVLVDPSTPDDALRQMAIATLRATIGLSRDIGAELLVIHPGGIYPSAIEPAAEGGVDRLVASLRDIRDLAKESGLLVTLENMPWFYQMKPVGGGDLERWESTILVTPGDMEVLADEVDGLTLDVSHGYLHSPRGGMEVIDGFIQDHGDRILHLHLSDALPPDHEGLQVGEGKVDFGSVFSALEGRDISAVPEIIGGHRGGGLGFRRALQELRRIEG
jgi:N-acetylneuraminate synthase